MDLHDESNNMNEKQRIERNKGRRERYRLRLRTKQVTTGTM